MTGGVGNLWDRRPVESLPPSPALSRVTFNEFCLIVNEEKRTRREEGRVGGRDQRARATREAEIR